MEQQLKHYRETTIQVSLKLGPRTERLEELALGYTEAEAELAAMDTDHPMWMCQMEVVIELKNDMIEELINSMKKTKPTPLLI